LGVVLVWVESDHYERPISGVYEELHKPLIFARAIVRLMSVFVRFHDNYIRAHVHEDIGAAPRAPVGNTLIKHNGVVEVGLADKVGDGALLGFVVADNLVVRVGVYKATVAVAHVCFIGYECTAMRG